MGGPGDGGGTPSTGGCPWAQTCRLLPQPTTQPVPKPAGVAVPTRSWGGPAALRMLVPSWDPLLPPKVPLLPWPPTPPPSKVSQKLEKQLLLKNLEGKFRIIIVKILKFNVVKKRRGAAAAAASGQEGVEGPRDGHPHGESGRAWGDSGKVKHQKGQVLPWREHLRGRLPVGQSPRTMTQKGRRRTFLSQRFLKTPQMHLNNIIHNNKFKPSPLSHWVNPGPSPIPGPIPGAQPLMMSSET